MDPRGFRSAGASDPQSFRSNQRSSFRSAGAFDRSATVGRRRFNQQGEGSINRGFRFAGRRRFNTQPLSREKEIESVGALRDLDKKKRESGAEDSARKRKTTAVRRKLIGKK